MSYDPIANLEILPPDALLGLMTAYRADTRKNKVDLGVGIFKNASGKTPILAAVRDAEQILAETGDTKAYEGPRGNPEFCSDIERLIYGEEIAEAKKMTITSFATPGGCGALNVGFFLVARAVPSSSVWVSNPTWPNHHHIAKSAGRNVKSFRYLASNGGIDFDGMIADLQTAQKGDTILLQGPCHNPTGIDISIRQWKQLAELIKANGLIPFIDIAYHGFGTSLEEDLNGVRAFLTIVPSAIISYSCSKNFGLYRERSGCLLVQTTEEEKTTAAATHIAEIARAGYSMPPAHGSAIVTTILNHPVFFKLWTDELSSMREHINGLRKLFSDALSACSRNDVGNNIVAQKGMFSMVPLKPGAAQRLQQDHGIYLPEAGRINIAGLSEDNIEYTAQYLAKEFA